MTVGVDKDALDRPDRRRAAQPDRPLCLRRRRQQPRRAAPVKVTRQNVDTAVVTRPQARRPRDHHEPVPAAAGDAGAASTLAHERELTPMRDATFGGISAPFIYRPIATTLLMAAVFLIGLVAYPLLPVAPLPQIDFPTIAVSATLPGRLARHDGVVGRPAARAPDRADPRRIADDVDERARRRPRSPCSSISTATSTPPPTTSRRRSTRLPASCRRTCRARRPIARSTRPTRRS